MHAHFRLLIFAIVFAGVRLSFPQSGDSINVRAIVEKLDNLYRSNSSYAEMEMQIVTPHWERTLALKAWSKGKDRAFILITSPQKEEGTATLRIGNEMWNYLPNTNKAMKIPPSMMSSSWMGSDFTNDDLVKEISLRDDYDYRIITPADAKTGLIYIEFIPRKEVPIVWSRIVTTIRAEDYLPVRDEYYDEKGKLMRILKFDDIRLAGGKKIPATIELIPQNKESQRTIIKYKNVQFDINISDDTFTLRNLMKGK